MTGRSGPVPFRALDGSSVHELAHGRAASLAEAAVDPGAATIPHTHQFEEIYAFTAGAGRMRLGAEELPVRAGDAVVIPPGTAHALRAGADGLRLLCVCSPPYSDEGTTLLED